MKKTIYLFIGGAALGIVATAALVKPANENVRPVATTSPRPVQGPVAIRQGMTEMGVPQAPHAETTNTAEMENASVTSANQDRGAATTRLPGASGGRAQAIPPSVAASPAVPPTSAQREQYRAIKNTLKSAANNPSVPLTDILKQVNTLTIEQRGELTRQALDMINRGELKPEQFASIRPGS